VKRVGNWKRPTKIQTMHYPICRRAWNRRPIKPTFGLQFGTCERTKVATLINDAIAWHCCTAAVLPLLIGLIAFVGATSLPRS
jgi:hypothetical protein